MYYVSVRNTEISNHCELKGFTSKKEPYNIPQKSSLDFKDIGKGDVTTTMNSHSPKYQHDIDRQ